MKRTFFKLAATLLAFPVCAQAQSRDLKFTTACDLNKTQIMVSFVGDVLIHKPLYQAVVAGSKDFSQIWRRTDSLIEKAHFSVANLEGPAALGIDRNGKDHGDIGFVYDGEVYSGTNFRFNYHPRILSNLQKSGYDLLTIANNHALDRGSIGIDKTIKAARAINMPVVGARSSSERNGNFYEIADIKGLKVAFLGCTEMTNGENDRKDQLLHCYHGQDVENEVKDLARSSDVDAVVVYPHWGNEYQPNPDGNQQRFARRWLEAGAAAVIGSHPHVLQPWEKYTTKDGRETLIAYSLGNFVAGQKDIPRRTGSVVYLGLSKNNGEKAKVFGVAYTPTYRDGWEIFPMGDGGDRNVLAYAQKNFGTVNRLNPGDSLVAKLCPGLRR
ncbi:MAG: CapA family protein [Bdellovibrio sp.]|nr:CapA family protein [Bdellovibrio sp.]